MTTIDERIESLRRALAMAPPRPWAMRTDDDDVIRDAGGKRVAQCQHQYLSDRCGAAIVEAMNLIGGLLTERDALIAANEDLMAGARETMGEDVFDDRDGRGNDR